MDVSKYIDHTELKPNATYDRIIELCKEAEKYKFSSVCINSFFTHMVVAATKSSDVSVCSVIGFPLGTNSLISKIVEAKDAVSNGADEIDVVPNISSVVSEDWTRVTEELQTLRNIVPYNVLKIILEVGLLTDTQIMKLCDVCISSRVDFVKTSTGFSTKLTSEETARYVKLIANQVTGSSVKIKASGGIRTLADFNLMIESGATRIGTSNGIKIMEEFYKSIIHET